MGMFIDLIYQLILPIAKSKGVDPDSVADAIKKNQTSVKTAASNIRKLFDTGQIRDVKGNIVKFEDVFPKGE